MLRCLPLVYALAADLPTNAQSLADIVLEMPAQKATVDIEGKNYIVKVGGQNTQLAVTILEDVRRWGSTQVYQRKWVRTSSELDCKEYVPAIDYGVACKFPVQGMNDTYNALVDKILHALENP